MRKIIDNQLRFDQVPIDEIQIDLQSRDEIPQLLLGLQAIYSNKIVLDQVCQQLKAVVPEDIKTNTGRPGLDLWNILVLGVIRLNCNWDYDKLHDISNNHRTIRQFLNIGLWDDHKRFGLQTIKDNVSLFTPEILDKLNEIIVNFGISEFKKESDVNLRGRCDSFVLETNVRYPTDTILLFESIRKVLTLTSQEFSGIGITQWRQYKSILKKLKRKLNKTFRVKASKSKNKAQKKEREELIIKIHNDFIDFSNDLITRSKIDLEIIRETSMIEKLNIAKILQIEKYINYAERLIDQVERRAVKGEKIPHSEKIFSIFEEYTEWISKGKAGVPVELGLRVCVLEDQHNFILHHHVMEQETDDKVAVKMVDGTLKKFPSLKSCSFDGGFYNPINVKELEKRLEYKVLPKKGKLSAEENEVVRSEKYIKVKMQHSAIESAINALENHGLDVCPDRGLDGFKRYVSLAILARNIQVFGSKVQKRKKKEQKRLERIESLRLKEAA